jgi:nucleoside-diphosphate-sugar epimerase
LIPHMLTEGYTLRAISRNGGRIGDLEVNAVDCCSYDQLAYYLRSNKVQGIIHLSARVPESQSHGELQASMLENALMTENVLRAASDLGVQRLVYASSTSVYGARCRLPITEKSEVSPLGFYALSKYMGELVCLEYARQCGMTVSCLRISAPYGPHMRNKTVVGIFIEQALKGGDLTIWNSGERTQDFTYINDVCAGIMDAYRYKAQGVFNISSNAGTSMNKLARIVLNASGKAGLRVVHVRHPSVGSRMTVSYDRAYRAFAYNPAYSITRGVEEYTDWIRRANDY